MTSLPPNDATPPAPRVSESPSPAVPASPASLASHSASSVVPSPPAGSAASSAGSLAPSAPGGGGAGGAAFADNTTESQLFINREISWLEFNVRVLAEAENPATPLYERLKFLGIVASNLDEFFMVRVAGLKQQIHGDVAELPPDGRTASEQLGAISARAHQLSESCYRVWNDTIRPRLAAEGIVLVKPEELAPAELELLDRQFRSDIFPVLTPITIDPNHPFPHLKNKSINLGVMFSRGEGEQHGFGVVQVPLVLNRVMRVSLAGARLAFVLLEDVIARHVGQLFPSYRLRGSYAFRVTRNWDLEIDEEEGEDLLQTIQQELRRRDRGNAVRVEISGTTTPGSMNRLCRALKIHAEEDVYRVAGPLHLADLSAMVGKDERRDMRDELIAPQIVPPLRDVEDMYAVLRERDVLLHQPYESFDSVVEFIWRAAEDPAVLAIKQTLYRAGGDSPIVKALARAAENGKQVTAIVELKARFDEESNIRWASTLENAGVHVVYGLQGLKTHAKALLVVRREKERLRRYVHLSTGNYNPSTARAYTDLSLLSARDEIGEDVTALFNLLTSYSAPPKWNRLIVAPLGLHEAVLGLIARETEHAKAGRPARIVAKMNALVDPDVIQALYAASQAGVEVTLLIRGICCLRPGVAGMSERIRVLAVVDRFLEHGRILFLANGGTEEVFLSSADWMPRNFHRRIELMVPLDDPALKLRVTQEILGIAASDNVKTWELRPDGHYTRVEATEPAVRSQMKFAELAREKVREADAKPRVATRFHSFGPEREPGLPAGLPERRRKKKRVADGPQSMRWKPLHFEHFRCSRRRLRARRGRRAPGSNRRLRGCRRAQPSRTSVRQASCRARPPPRAARRGDRPAR
jgi:polyphosphate kinase